MKTTPVNRLKEYTGPNNHNAIIKQIIKEAQEEKRDISEYFIKRTIALFFSANGFPYHFKDLKTFCIKGLGCWKVKPRKRDYFLMKQAELKEKKRKKRNAPTPKFNKIRSRIYRRKLKKIAKVKERLRKVYNLVDK